MPSTILLDQHRSVGFQPGGDDHGQPAIIATLPPGVEVTPEIPSGYEIVINGGRTPMGIDAIEWAQRGEELGAGELVINSIDADGTKEGYEINLTRTIAETVTIPVIASGGGGTPEHLYEVLTEGKADAALIASMLHYDEYKVGEVKEYLAKRGLKIRLTDKLTEDGRQ